MKREIFRNEYVAVNFCNRDEKPYIHFFDLKDKHNDYQGYTRNVRGIATACAFIEQLSQDERLKFDITFHDVLNLLEDANLKPHTFCGLD